jgi:hypothetical protein
MVGFLRQICRIPDEENPSGESGTTKILITTRPEDEVGVAIPERNLLRISNSDIAGSVKLVVTDEVAKLVAHRDVPLKAQTFIIGEVLGRCGPVFQKGITAVRLLGERHSLDLNNQEAVKGVLQGFNFEKYNDFYTSVLESIHPEDQEIAAKIIRILYFTREYLNLEELLYNMPWQSIKRIQRSMICRLHHRRTQSPT